MESSAPTTRKFDSDFAGMIASIVCSIHCALVPLLMSLPPVMGVDLFSSKEVDLVMIFLAASFAVWAAARGYLRAHHNPWIVGAFALGVIVLFAGHFVFDHSIEPYFGITGGVILVIAHVLNYKLIHRLAHLDDDPDAEPAAFFHRH